MNFPNLIYKIINFLKKLLKYPFFKKQQYDTFNKYVKTPIPIRKYLKKYLNFKKTLFLFDIGACEGEDSIRYSNFFPFCKIIAFEPRPDNYQKILDHIKKYHKQNIFPYQLALSNYKGQSTFYLSSGSPTGSINPLWNYGNKSSSLLKPGANSKKYYQWLNFNEQISVPVDTLFNFCNQKKISEIDFMHIDAQGAELLILKGAETMLTNIRMIWLEVENIELYENQPLKKDIESFMADNNFYKLVDSVDLITGDQLYLNKKYYL